MDLRWEVTTEIFFCHKVTLILLIIVIFIIIILIVRSKQLGYSWVNAMFHVVIVEGSLVRAVNIAEYELVTELGLQLQESHEHHPRSAPNL